MSKPGKRPIEEEVEEASSSGNSNGNHNGNDNKLSLSDFKESDEKDHDLFQYFVDDSITNVEVDMLQGK